MRAREGPWMICRRRYVASFEHAVVRGARRYAFYVSVPDSQFVRRQRITHGQANQVDRLGQNHLWSARPAANSAGSHVPFYLSCGCRGTYICTRVCGRVHLACVKRNVDYMELYHTYIDKCRGKMLRDSNEFVTFNVFHVASGCFSACIRQVVAIKITI